MAVGDLCACTITTEFHIVAPQYIKDKNKPVEGLIVCKIQFCNKNKMSSCTQNDSEVTGEYDEFRVIMLATQK